MGEAADVRTLDFIESDGEPMGETELHGEQGAYLVQAFRCLARRRGVPDAHVGSNLFFYWDRNDARRCVCPDVFFVLGLDAPERLRRTFKTWEERSTPQLIVEVASRATWKEDLGEKKRIYREVLGTLEYVVFDPEERIRDDGPLVGWRLVRGRYRRAGAADRFDSQVVGGALQVIDGRLRLLDARGAIVPGDVDSALREDVVSVLEARFGALPPSARERLDAGCDRERALVQAATAPTLDVFLRSLR